MADNIYLGCQLTVESGTATKDTGSIRVGHIVTQVRREEVLVTNIVVRHRRRQTRHIDRRQAAVPSHGADGARVYGGTLAPGDEEDALVRGLRQTGGGDDAGRATADDNVVVGGSLSGAIGGSCAARFCAGSGHAAEGGGSHEGAGEEGPHDVVQHCGRCVDVQLLLFLLVLIEC